MDKLINDSQDELLWKKFFLLPTILLSSLPGRQRNAEIIKRIDLLQKDEWFHFTVGFFNRRFNPRNSHSLDQQHTRTTNIHGEFSLSESIAFKQMKAGNISKAMDALTNSTVPALFDDNMFQNLKSKFPSPGNACLDEADLLEAYSPFSEEEVNEKEIVSFEIKRSDLIRLVGGKKIN
jgi:hypothetical protein